MTSNADLRARLVAVDNAISEQMRRLQELQSQRQSILEELGRIVYPILSLPNEITTEIFLHSLPDTPSPHPNYYCFPMTPLSVCRAWRALAISTPRLWDRLVLDLRSPRLRTHLLEIVDDWFSRAGSHFSTLIVWALNWEGERDAISDVVRPILQRHGSRLRVAEFEMTEEHYIMLADSIPFPVLEYVALNVVGEWFSDSTTTLFNDAPRLKRLIFGSASLPEHIDLPYERLEEIIMNCEISLELASDVLWDAPHLQELHCSLLAPATASTHVEHPNLNTLILGHHSSPHIFRFIRFPALRWLFLYKLDDTVDMPGDEFQAFLSHSSNSLLRFSYHGFDQCAIDFRWLDVARNLTCIEISTEFVYVPHPTFSEAVSGFVHHLDRGSHGAFLPNLNSLELADQCFMVDAETLGQILCTRCDEELGAGMATLQRFSLIGVAPGFGFEALSDLVGLGMQIHVGPNVFTNLLV